MSSSSDIRAITFDVGGTLIAPWPSVGHIYSDIAARFGVSRIDGDIRRVLINHVGKDVHSSSYSNNPAFLAQAVEQIAQWVVNQSAIAAAQASGANVVRLQVKTNRIKN